MIEMTKKSLLINSKEIMEIVIDHLKTEGIFIEECDIDPNEIGYTINLGTTKKLIILKEHGTVKL